MAKMNSKHRYMFDAAPSVALIPQSDPAKTASFVGAAHTLDTVGGYWNAANELADTAFAVVVNVTDVDKTTGDETYKLDLQASGDGFATNVVIGTIARVPARGEYVILVDPTTVKAVLPTVTQIRLAGTLAGTTPSIDLFAWLAGEIKK